MNGSLAALLWRKMYQIVQNSYFKIGDAYNLAICYLSASTQVSENLVIGGLMARGLLGQNEDDINIY